MTLLAWLAAARAEDPDLAALAWAEVVLVGPLEAQERGGTGLSMPPIHTGSVRLASPEALRGSVPEALRYALRQPTAPEWTVGARYLVAAAADGAISLIVSATPEVEAAARHHAALPLGWAPGRSPWPDDRPPWLAGADLVWTAAFVPPEVPQKFKNDRGDGQFTLTLTNPTAAPVTVEALRRDASGILWAQCVLAGPHRFTDAPLPADTEPVVLGPGESVSTVVDTLTLDGIAWPRGGARVPFTFALGEKAASTFFYYSSVVHHPVREGR